MKSLVDRREFTDNEFMKSAKKRVIPSKRQVAKSRVAVKKMQAFIRRAKLAPGVQFMVCVSREAMGEFSADDLTIGRIYSVLSPADSQGMVRVIDDSGEDYLYPVRLFGAVKVPAYISARRRGDKSVLGRDLKAMTDDGRT